MGRRCVPCSMHWRPLKNELGKRSKWPRSTEEATLQLHFQCMSACTKGIYLYLSTWSSPAPQLLCRHHTCSLRRVSPDPGESSSPVSLCTTPRRLCVLQAALDRRNLHLPGPRGRPCREEKARRCVTSSWSGGFACALLAAFGHCWKDRGFWGPSSHLKDHRAITCQGRLVCYAPSKCAPLSFLRGSLEVPEGSTISWRRFRVALPVRYPTAPSGDCPSSVHIKAVTTVRVLVEPSWAQVVGSVQTNAQSTLEHSLLSPESELSPRSLIRELSLTVCG
ncbi:uncharacterized protein J3D65DRAFT_403875 [Phyllosticta citribraziliensis]|uniref:Uncharacterized protein n=1 Tax=Phyllosticta citribraziliensis TaxID=989973 RepID=A0ABR1LLN5_9PEZI